MPGDERFSGRGLWLAVWPKVAAVAIAIFLWQLVVWSGWRTESILPSPFTAFDHLRDLWNEGVVTEAVGITLWRALIGFTLALVIGVAIGVLVTSSKILRSAIGSLITGLQTMPSIAWFPLAIVLFQLSEAAIRFVVVLGAAPSIANGLIHGVDHIPPLLVRAGTTLGANRRQLFRHVIAPAALPSFVGGLKQGWAFAWRSLLAGELLVTLGRQSLGFLLAENRATADYRDMVAIMIVILLVGIILDAILFGTLDRWVRTRWGLRAD